MKKTIIFMLIIFAGCFKATCQSIDKQTLSSGNGLVISGFGESVQYIIGQAYQTNTLENNTYALTQGFLQPAFSLYPSLELGQIEIYPNPAIDYVNVSLNLLDNQGAQGSIINIWGQVLVTQNFNVAEGNQKLYFPFGNLAAGVYMVKVIANGNTYVKKLMIK